MNEIISNSIKGTFIAVLHFSQIRFFYPIFKFYRGKKRSLFVTNITEIPLSAIPEELHSQSETG
jgi:hypothetical protein